MMKAKHLLKYAVPALALAGLTLTACDKEPDNQTATPVYRAPYEKELGFDGHNIDSIEMPIVRYFINDTACKQIYLTVRNPDSFTGYSDEGIHNIRNYMNERTEASNKVSGRGMYRFIQGRARPEDSIWFEQHGWTVNHR
ncbi:MAG: hypothetical protein K2O53_02355 [Bacteroidales bacterium]|nr:hypothetical protein [Bacteroidales bacterium]